MGFRLHLCFHFSSFSALQLIVRSFVYGILFFQLSSFTFSRPSSLFISPREDQTIPRMRQFLLRPTQTIVRWHGHRLRSTSLLSGVIVWRYLWSIRMEHGHRLEHFFLEYGSLMEFDDRWIGHLFLWGSSDD